MIIKMWLNKNRKGWDSVAGGLFRRRGAAGMQRLPQFAESLPISETSGKVSAKSAA